MAARGGLCSRTLTPSILVRIQVPSQQFQRFTIQSSGLLFFRLPPGYQRGAARR
jgi:hypothetical protein